MPVVLFLMAITLNVVTGEETARTMVSGPYKTDLECEQANVATGFQHPVDGQITVFNCVQLTAPDQT
jgi:hypothetical protein